MYLFTYVYVGRGGGASCHKIHYLVKKWSIVLMNIGVQCLLWYNYTSSENAGSYPV